VAADQSPHPISPDDARQILQRLDVIERRQRMASDFLVRAYWSALDEAEARSAAPTDQLQCLACGEAAPRAAHKVWTATCAFGGGRLERCQCPACGCIFGPQKCLRAAQGVLDADLALVYENYKESDGTAHEIRAFRLLDPKPGGLYLNWGCGAWSSAIETLRAEGYDVWGFEPNVEAASPFVARSRAEISAKFDGIFSNNVLEHMSDPHAQFQEFAALLKPGGRMVHATPCYEHLCADTRFHVFFPLGEAPARLAARSGFTLQGAVRDGGFDARIFARAEQGA
jgi:SAM-dependent methyltransferase